MRVLSDSPSPSADCAANMPRAFLIKKNYSNCPLKKRPVYLVDSKDESEDASEPENLSTKPEDLRIKQEHSHPAKLPLEPLDLNAPAPEPVHPAHPAHPGHYQTPPAWPHYAAYLPFAYPYPGTELYHPHYPATPYPGARSPSLEPRLSPQLSPQLSPYRERESAGSPPAHVGFSAACIPRAPQSLPTHCGLSPTSSTSSQHSGHARSVFQVYSPPPATPEDLSSPGSVASSGSLGSAGSGSGLSSILKKRKEPAGSPRYQCSDCNKSYSTYSGLSKHQQFHCLQSEKSSAPKKFACQHCDKVYVSLGALKMHIRTHTLPCRCPLCGKAFSRPWLLQGHIRTHTGEKPFQCQHCRRAFADRSNLRAHLQTHADVKKYQCVVCNKTFSRMSLLTKHTGSGCR